MTREGAIKWWEVIKAFREGAEVEAKQSNGYWMKLEDPNFHPEVEFRIKE